MFYLSTAFSIRKLKRMNNKLRIVRRREWRRRGKTSDCFCDELSAILHVSRQVSWFRQAPESMSSVLLSPALVASALTQVSLQRSRVISLIVIFFSSNLFSRSALWWFRPCCQSALKSGICRWDPYLPANLLILIWWFRIRYSICFQTGHNLDMPTRSNPFYIHRKRFKLDMPTRKNFHYHFRKRVRRKFFGVK